MSSMPPQSLTDPIDSVRRAKQSPVEIRAARTSNLTLRKLNWIVRGLALVIAMISCVIPVSALAQFCALEDRPLFAGHSLPLDGSPDPQAMNFVRAFPNLSFQSPVGIYSAPDGSDRLFVLEQRGRIYAFENRADVSQRDLYLNIQTLVEDGGELGLLGLAFDPDFANNRRFYLNYTASNGCTTPDPWCTKIVRYEQDALDPSQADPTSGLELLQFPQFQSNHNGGAVAFGPDGMLYIASGDGGGGGDPQENGQDLSTPLGAILRIDVSEGAPSLIPADNPFVGVPGADERVFHFGLRNPWRMTFDRATGDLYIGDVGQDEVEEIDFVAAGSPGGLNFGWNFCEGTLDYQPFETCDSIDSVPPVIEYPHNFSNGGFVVIGGYVYRGDKFPALQGAYVYHDGTSGLTWAWDRTPAADPNDPGNPGVVIASGGPLLSSFGEDRNGELLGVSLDGFVYELEESGSGGSETQAFPSLLSETGLFSDVASLTVAPGVVPYSVTAPLWSDAASKSRWIALPGSQRVVFHAEDAWEFPIGTALIKHFEWPDFSTGGTLRLETRVFLRQNERWIGVTYKWNAAQTDADLLTGEVQEIVDLGAGLSLPWTYPSPAACLGCHTDAGGRVLGPRTRQLDAALVYPTGVQNQLDAWNCGELFDFDIRDPARYPASSPIFSSSDSRTHRVRSYVDSNCAHCHQPGGPAIGQLDLRFGQAVSDWNVLDVDPTEGDLGLPNAKRIAVGDHTESVFHARQESTDPLVKMARGSMQVHGTAVDLIADWIDIDTPVIDSDGDGFLDAVDVCPAIADPSQSDSNMNGIGDACDPASFADLRIERLYANTSAVVAPGIPFTLAVTVTNEGATDAGDFPITVYLSEDLVFDPVLDPSIGDCWLESLPPGGIINGCVVPSLIPSDFMDGAPTSGPIYWAACVNRAGVEAEANMTDNCEVSPDPIMLPEPGIGAMLLTGCIGLGLARGRGRRTFIGLGSFPASKTAH